jgi:MFS superfamily sulfate permease-like transporter
MMMATMTLMTVTMILAGVVVGMTNSSVIDVKKIANKKGMCG